MQLDAPSPYSCMLLTVQTVFGQRVPSLSCLTRLCTSYHSLLAGKATTLNHTAQSSTQWWGDGFCSHNNNYYVSYLVFLCNYLPWRLHWILVLSNLKFTLFEPSNFHKHCHKVLLPLNAIFTTSTVLVLLMVSPNGAIMLQVKLAQQVRPGIDCTCPYVLTRIPPILFQIVARS